eukprot:comp18643_c1_seq1/m.20269 comp18643_c1_seq1/g.20269  ORF comp18643_c1_seq1/g.20269 comp18643_c1_seq1/m.20269 type:complete len:282 (-) comp18643_c1_seq1:76-921(-)
MARNEEKAMSMLSRFRRAQDAELGKIVDNKRPFLASECHKLPEAEKWRNQIIREISKKVSQIQNTTLSEFKIRDLNDEINKLLREKGHWEDRIKELGGKDYKRIGPKMLDREGKEVPGQRGYRYFGAAKDLPGVRELFEQEAVQAPRKTRAQLTKSVDADYYGYRDDDDGVLIPLEQVEEKIAIQRAVAAFETAKANGTLEGDSEEEDLYFADKEGDELIVAVDEDVEATSSKFVAHVPVPTQKEVEEYLINRRKQELLERYASADLRAEEEGTKELTGRK